MQGGLFVYLCHFARIYDAIAPLLYHVNKGRLMKRGRLRTGRLRLGSGVAPVCLVRDGLRQVTLSDKSCGKNT